VQNAVAKIIFILISILFQNWVVPEIIHTPPTEEISTIRRGRGGSQNLFLIIVNVLGRPKWVVGLTSNFLCGGGTVWIFT
jgi:hypothetical protein